MIQFSSRMDVILDDELDDDHIETLLQSILAMDNVLSAEFIHPDQALQELTEVLGVAENDSSILMSLAGDQNPLRRSIRLGLVDARLAEETAAAIRQMQGVFRANPIWEPMQ